MIVRATSTNHLPMPPGHSSGRSTDRLHVSQLIRIVGKAMGQYNEFETTLDASGNDITPNLALCLGLAWEDWYSKVSSIDAVFHPGEIELDNIVGSPDAIGVTACGNYHIVHEFKLTWQSIKPIETVWKWVAQAKAYCKMLSTTHAVLHVFYIHGAYTRGVPAGELAVVYSYHIEFTDDELDINWRHLLAAAETIKEDQAPDNASAIDLVEAISNSTTITQEQSHPWESSTPAAATHAASPSPAASSTPSPQSPATIGGKVLNWPKR